MSSTRKAKDDSVFHQGRYASSPEFERGLLANLVAKRCALIDVAADRELIWFVQFLSHQEGSLAALSRDLLEKYSDRVGTATMLKLAKCPEAYFTAAEVRQIRMELPPGETCDFPLRGETRWDINRLEWRTGEDRMTRQVRILSDLADEAPYNVYDSEREKNRAEGKGCEESEKHPSSYPVVKLNKLCWDAAQSGCHPYRHGEQETYNLGRELAEMCLNPQWDFGAGGPWYFPRLVETLREYKTNFVKQKTSGIVVTTLGKEVCDALDYTSYGRILTLMQGEARTGKSFAAHVWCEQHPGQARFVEVPPSNDEAGFFRALARGLGLGNFLNYKAAEIRERVESVLLSCDLMLVLDEAQRLWPQSNYRQAFPRRIVWVMTMANAGVPIAMISTPQFIQTQKAVEKSGWNSAQLTGRIAHYVSLPVDLSLEDLKGVARAVLPEADADVLRALATYARTSARYLAAIDSISKRARYISRQAGREKTNTNDVRKAMQQSVIPADTKLNLALANGKRPQPVAEPAPMELAPHQTATMPVILPKRGNLEAVAD